MEEGGRILCWPDIKSEEEEEENVLHDPSGFFLSTAG